MSDNIIETNMLTRNYGSLVAVNQINLQVPEGSIYGFLGPNGAGKTTTIRMLLQLIQPSSGSIRFFGKPLDKYSTEQAKNIGTLVETPSYYPHLTGKENLELMRRLRGDSSQAVDRVLEIVNLSNDAKVLVKHYSLGMRQRLGLAMAFLGNPKVLVLDEPTNGLDPSGIHEIRELIRRLPDESGVTIFLSSHLLAEVEQIATVIGIIQKGKLIFQGNPSLLHTYFKNQLIIRVDRPKEAYSYLQNNGYRPEVSNNHQIIVPIQKQEDAARVNKLLSDAGFTVFDFHAQQQSLEDIFLKITNSN